MAVPQGWFARTCTIDGVASAWNGIDGSPARHVGTTCGLDEAALIERNCRPVLMSIGAEKPWSIAMLSSVDSSLHTPAVTRMHT